MCACSGHRRMRTSYAAQGRQKYGESRFLSWATRRVQTCLPGERESVSTTHDVPVAVLSPIWMIGATRDGVLLCGAGRKGCIRRNQQPGAEPSMQCVKCFSLSMNMLARDSVCKKIYSLKPLWISQFICVQPTISHHRSQLRNRDRGTYATTQSAQHFFRPCIPITNDYRNTPKPPLTVLGHSVVAPKDANTAPNTVWHRALPAIRRRGRRESSAPAAPYLH
jgi:hypothetical protein